LKTIIIIATCHDFVMWHDNKLTRDSL